MKAVKVLWTNTHFAQHSNSRKKITHMEKPTFVTNKLMTILAN
ncbi:hypothetical protein MNBD_ALPHA11-1113 [hydrothermal vent metagenome]|uniref:Uncharacterized protein n=1 Tax=hydrothermal vent metagenome TaxID=652676 RepID=A0A3B0TRG2_9ZZZZ